MSELEVQTSPWRPIKKDFVFDTTCHHCNRPLSSNVAVLLANEKGILFPFGPVCARRALGAPIRGIPNLTVAINSANAGKERPSSASTGKGSSSKPATAAEKRRERAVTYLSLRMDLLRHIPGVFYPKLFAANERFRAGLMTEDDIEQVLNVEEWNEANLPKFGLRNLLTFYAYERALVKVLPMIAADRRDFLITMRTKLHRKFFFSRKEARAIQNWVDKIPNHGVLDPEGFDWAWPEEDKAQSEVVSSSA